jgi:hypothetical protein
MEKGGNTKLRARAKSTHTKRVDGGEQIRYNLRNLRRARSEERSFYREEPVRKTKVIKPVIGKKPATTQGKTKADSEGNIVTTPWPKKKTVAILKDWTPNLPRVPESTSGSSSAAAEDPQQGLLKRVTMKTGYCLVPFLPDLPQSTPRAQRTEQATPPEVPVNSPPLIQFTETIDRQQQSNDRQCQEIDLKQENEKLKNELARRDANSVELKRVVQKFERKIREKNEQIAELKNKNEKEVEKISKENLLLRSRLGKFILFSGIHSTFSFNFQIHSLKTSKADSSHSSMD